MLERMTFVRCKSSSSMFFFQAASRLDMSKRVKRVYRTRIGEKPDVSINLWSIMKNCIGKELTKIPMPVSVYLDIIEISELLNFIFCVRYN